MTRENTKGKTPQSSDCPVTLLKCNKSCQDILELKKKQITKKINEIPNKHFGNYLRDINKYYILLLHVNQEKKCLVTDNGY